MKAVIELESENLSGLGGPMGSEHTSTNWTKLFTTVKAAKAAAEADYGKPIKWSRANSPTCNGRPIDLTCSGDLFHVMYHIKRVKVGR